MTVTQEEWENLKIAQFAGMLRKRDDDLKIIKKDLKKLNEKINKIEKSL